MSSFGSRLQRARIDRGLSQAELGGDRYSGSYISHLEKGRREPTPEVLHHLASQLGMDPAALGGHDGDRGALNVAIAEMRALAAWDERDYTGTVALADQARTAAIKESRPASWWAATHLMAKAMILSEDYDACVATTRELYAHHFTTGVPELECEALQLSSRALRASGHLEEALIDARSAIESAREASPSSPARVMALLAEVSALGELGRPDDAGEAAAALRALREDAGSADVAFGPHLLGQVAWALGNLAMMQGDTARGIAEHDAAAQLLNPASDLRSWGRFCNATATMRLSAGTLDGVESYLDLAADALRLVGIRRDLAELSMSRAEFILARGDAAAALAACDAISTENLSATFVAGREMLRYRCLLALDRRPEAALAAREAAEAFEEAGAVVRALEAWKAHADA